MLCICAGVIVSGIALVLSCCLREAVQLTDSLKTPGKAALAGEDVPLVQVWFPAQSYLSLSFLSSQSQGHLKGFGSSS